jgi:glycosyltransferase involved in cell wall biosynthesis
MPMQDPSGSATPPPLRVLLISQHFWPENFRINQVVDDLRDAGAEVTVLTGQPNYPEGRTFAGYSAWRWSRERHPAGYEIVRVPVVPRGRGGHVRRVFVYLSFILSGILFGTILLRGRRFDVQFVYATSPVFQGLVGGWLRLVKGAPLVLWVQDVWPAVLIVTGVVRSRPTIGLVSFFVSWLYKSCDLILGQSEAMVPEIARLAGRVPIRYFPNPGEHDPSGEAPAPALPDKFNIVFGGTLGDGQSVKTLVDAAERLRGHDDIHFTLFGWGVRSDWIAGEIAKRGLTNLTLGGLLPLDAMPGVYRQASALLVSLRANKGLSMTVPSKLQSYLRAGVPVIAAIDGEAARIVREAGAGLAVPAEDPAALAEAILALKAMPAAERAAMGICGRRFYEEHYPPGPLAAALKSMLADVAEGGKA